MQAVMKIQTEDGVGKGGGPEMGSSKQTHTGNWRISARDAVPVTVLGILGEYEREHPGAVERFQQSQAEVDERLVQQALRRQEHQHARFVQEAERARYIKNFQARQLIKRALRRQMQQQAAARYEQYQARARQLGLERERLEQTKNEILMAMKKRGEEERIQGVALALESVHGRVESSSLEHSRRDRFDRQSSVTYFASPQQIQALDSWQKWASGTYPQGSRNSLPAIDPTTPRHGATLLGDCKLDNDPILSSMTPDHTEDDCERSGSLAWIFAGTKELYPGASSEGQPTPKRIVAKAQIQDSKSLHPGAVGKESAMGSGDAASRDQFAEELIIPQAPPYTASTIECLNPLLVRVPSGDASLPSLDECTARTAEEYQAQGRGVRHRHNTTPTSGRISTTPMPDALPQVQWNARPMEDLFCDRLPTMRYTQQDQRTQRNRSCSIDGWTALCEGGSNTTEQKRTKEAKHDEGTDVQPLEGELRTQESATVSTSISDSKTRSEPPQNVNIVGREDSQPFQVLSRRVVRSWWRKRGYRGSGSDPGHQHHDNSREDESRAQLHPASVHQPSELQEEGRVLVAQHIEDLQRLRAQREDKRQVVAEEELKKRSTGSETRQTGIGIDAASWAMREGFTDSESFTAAVAWPDSRCQSPQNTSQVAVDNEPRRHSPRMGTSNPTFGRDKPLLASPNAASTRTPDLFHAADTVQIAGGTFTTAGTVTNITYSVTVPSRSYLPSIPLPSWFNRVRLS
ncbi:hypothetical protein BKA70DRAFT_732367 [Coprinopsis sp. MPI-PUGE-AT-0042]|nr:hypothetical protein BKA70DRAFT_732367 [Coprinopsis sp. MPI-PUGE-AT-0042]